jgi:ABC-type Fe3+ transport system permease subunit
MNANKHFVALMEVLLILPAALFMTCLAVRQLPASGLDIAAQRTVMWYANQQWTLWLLLVTLPLVVLAVGCGTLLQGWSAEHQQTHDRRQLAGTTIFIAALTFTAAVILAIVSVHLLAN